VVGGARIQEKARKGDEWENGRFPSHYFSLAGLFVTRHRALAFMPFFRDMATRSDFRLSHLAREVIGSPVLPTRTDTVSDEPHSMHVSIARTTQYFGFALAVEDNMKPKNPAASVSLNICNMLMLTPFDVATISNY
jgi:hypothetical protein